ncbi:STAS domain-containing protein [Aureibacter tunicatorum]|uniref:Anti-sigma factor antagonist n=1 Tax=Aureibacter tunicatorum TaxID=866807 RepID=A0AAE4BTD0_9BACT|nr:STAS domain-containing protein [Aureibacter tunicatorum]MDR6239713.1 anti-anti-sigma factor [Aureibacter tunicatorum]BDD04189.1 hypothetical protein AUTU_16720 [Aureibacter tunicatorum]
MKYSIDQKEQYTLIKPHEEKFDSEKAPDYKTFFIKLSNEGTPNIIFDLSDVKYVDSSGLSAILVGNRLYQDAGGLFAIANLSPHVKKLIEISQLDSVLTILQNVEESVDAVFLNELERDLKSSEE